MGDMLKPYMDKNIKVDILVSSSYLLKGDINNKVKYIKEY